MTKVKRDSVLKERWIRLADHTFGIKIMSLHHTDIQSANCPQPLPNETCPLTPFPMRLSHPLLPVSSLLFSSLQEGGAFVKREHKDLTEQGTMSQQTKTAQ